VTSVRLSPGRLTSLWAVLRSLRALGLSVDRTELLRHASRTSLRAGGLPIPDGFTLALEGEFVRLTGEQLSLAPLGEHALSLQDGDEPGLEVRRLFISVLLLRDPPPWVAYWQGAPSTLALIVPESERDLLAEADLFPASHMSDLEAWSWWDALRVVPLPAETSALRKVIGDAGEELSFRFEQQRLRADGFSDLAARVRWVARESPAYGFDVLSFHGATHGGDPRRPLAVEVKAISRPVVASLDFFLTAHEWSTASSLGPDYVIHFWDAVDPGPPLRSSSRAPRVLANAQLSDHLPVEPSCAKCAWESAHLSINIAQLDASGARDSASHAKRE
jgi:uncharacterized protein DUF3883